jgi:predicted nucleotidyltransferase
MVFSSFLFTEASKFSMVPLNGLFMLTRYPDDIELMEDMLKTSNELKELTDKVINLVTKEFQVDEIILFGSYAQGTATDLSDVDVLVISPQFKE